MRKKYRAGRIFTVILILLSVGYGLFLAWLLIKQTGNLFLAAIVGVICALAPLVFLILPDNLVKLFFQKETE